jgi:three-Cys-motif partner protein
MVKKYYASAYSRIMSSQASPQFYHLYIDAFAGAGKHISRSTGEFVPGSPENALLVKPPFREYHFIDLNKLKIESLENMAGTREDVHIHFGDCNQVMMDKVLPIVKYENYRRALCVLDPYGLHLDWEVIYTAGQMKSVEIGGEADGSKLCDRMDRSHMESHDRLHQGFTRLSKLLC